jgi:hypothetical protein
MASCRKVTWVDVGLGHGGAVMVDLSEQLSNLRKEVRLLVDAMSLA